jgi:hypothetical protein
MRKRPTAPCADRPFANDATVGAIARPVGPDSERLIDRAMQTMAIPRRAFSSARRGSQQIGL